MESRYKEKASSVASTLYLQVVGIELENERLKQLYEKAIADIPRTCRYCAKGQNKLFANWRADEHCLACRRDRMCNWIWRGLKEEK